MHPLMLGDSGTAGPTCMQCILAQCYAAHLSLWMWSETASYTSATSLPASPLQAQNTKEHEWRAICANYASLHAVFHHCMYLVICLRLLRQSLMQASRSGWLLNISSHFWERESPADVWHDSVSICSATQDQIEKFVELKFKICTTL